MPLRIVDVVSPPVFPDDPLKTRRARITFVCGAACFVGTVCLIGVLSALVPALAPRAVLFLPFLVLLLCLSPVLRRGRVTLAGLGVLAGFWVTVTLFAAVEGGLGSPAVHYYILLVVQAGLLFRARGVIVTLAAVLVTGLGLFYAQSMNLLPVVFTPATLQAWVAFDVAVVVAMVLTNIALEDTARAFVGLQREVEERRRVEAALRASEDRFKSLSQAAFEGLMIHDRGTILDANPAFAALFGVPIGEIIGKKGLDVLPLTAASRDLIRKSIEANSSDAFEIEIVRPDDTCVAAETQGREIVYEGRPARVVGMRDITARKHAEAETRRRLAELEAINTVSAALRAAATVEDFLPILMDETLTLFGSAVGAIWLYDVERSRLQQTEGRGWMREFLHESIDPGRGIGGEVFATGEPHIAREFRTDAMTQDSVRLRIPPGWGGPCVPIRSAAGVMGVLVVAVEWPRRFQPSEVRLLTTLAEIAGSAVHRMRLHEQTLHDARAIAQAYETTLEGWVRALDLRDKETEGHSLRVTEMTVRLARAMAIGEPDIEPLRRGALLHDIGKMGISDAIVQKPGPLSDEEWDVMRRHPRYAYDLLSRIEYLAPALDIPYCHHERWNGSGYPRGLRGEEIPLSARIFAVVDVWDALCSDRPYRAPVPPPLALEYIRSRRGTDFEPRVVDEFLRLITAAR